jgi:hypothetical protein
MTTPTLANHPDTDEIARAEQQVALRKAELARSLREAGRSSARAIDRLGTELKPALVAATVVVGAAVVSGVALALWQRRARRGWLRPEPSPIADLARGAGLWLARVAVRRLAEELARRVAAGVAEPGDALASNDPRLQ